MLDKPPIQIIGPDDFPACRTCHQRMATAMTKVSGQWMPVSVGSDEDGPIFRAVCKDHGPHDFQVETEETTDA